MRLKLSNCFYSVNVDPGTGNLLQLTPSDDHQPIVRQVFVRYQANGRSYSENGEDPLAAPPEVVSVRRTRTGVSSLLRTPHLEIRRRFQMAPGSPLLRIRYEFIATASATLHGPGLLFLGLAEDLNDVTRDEKDLYFDGAELGDRRELPCWRVLYRAGHRRGILVAARSKWQMSHLMYDGQRIEVRPHVRAQQQVDYGARDIPITVAPGTRHVVEMEIGPWRTSEHDVLVRAAALDKPALAAIEKTPVPSRRPVTGEVLWMADWARKRTVTDTFDPRRWMRLSLPWDARQKALVCNTGCRPPAFHIKPVSRGPCRVFVGASRSASVGLHFSGDPYPVYRMGIEGTAFHSVLYGAEQAGELYFGVVDMTDRTVRVVPNHNGHWPARLDYLRLEPLSPSEAAAWRQRQSTPMRTRLAGIPDCGDVFFYLLDRRALDPRLVEGNLWEQARVGFTRLYWQMHGTYTGFWTQIGTRHPMVCKAHGAFEPQAKAGVLFHRKYDLLRLAVDAGRKLGIELWGASRMNAYMSGKRDEFFQKNPQMAEISEDGLTCENKICYAFQAVRDYQRAILVEAAQYGLPGIMLGFLRHAPMFLYHPLLVGGYRARYGKLPPRDMGVKDPYHLHSLPEDGPEYRQWYAYRAEFMTQFGRDLKRDLRDRGLGHVKLSLWLRPNHCLFDGINVEDWLKEGLCDEIIADIYYDAAGDEPRPQWRKMVQSRVPLIKGIGFSNPNTYAASRLPRILREGYDGICAYGSEQFAQTAQNLELLDLLRADPRR